VATFQAAAAFASDAATELRLLPLRFERLGANRFLVANLVGDLLLLTGEELDRVVSLAIRPRDGLYERAFEKLLVAGEGQRSQLQLIALRMRSRMAFYRNRRHSISSSSPCAASIPAPIAKCRGGVWTGTVTI
jgi:uncharacterized protein